MERVQRNIVIFAAVFLLVEEISFNCLEDLVHGCCILELERKKIVLLPVKFSILFAHQPGESMKVISVFSPPRFFLVL